MADLLFEGVVAYGNGDIEPMEKPTVNFLAGGCKFDDHQAVRVLDSVFFTARGRALNVIAPDRFDAGKYEFRENTYYKLSGPPLAWNERSFEDLPSWQRATGLDATSRVVEGRPDQAWVFLRPNRYEADKAFLIGYNWPRTARVSVDQANLWRLTPGTPFRVVSVEDIWGGAAAEGRFEGEPAEVPMTGVYAPEFAGWDHEAWYYATCYSRSHNSPPKGSADRIMHGWAKQKNTQALNAAIKDMLFGMRLIGHDTAFVAETGSTEGPMVARIPGQFRAPRPADVSHAVRQPASLREQCAVRSV